MKAFLSDFSSPQMYEIALFLKEQGLDIVYWTASKWGFENAKNDNKNFLHTIVQSQYDGAQAIPAEGVDASAFPPPSAELIQALLECETITLTMITRMDFSNMPYIKKKQLYYKYVQYWDGVLKQLQPEVIFFCDVPHAGFNFVLYSLAKHYGIATVMFEVGPVQDRFVLVRDYKKSCENLLEEYQKIKDEVHTIDELDEDAKNYFLRMTKTGLDVTPSYKKTRDIKMKKPLRVLPQMRNIFKAFGSGKFLKTSWYYLRSFSTTQSKARIFNIDIDDHNDYKTYFHLKKFNILKKKLREEYESLQHTPDIKEKFVYLPLHYQPECTTSPLAGFYADLVLMVKTVAAGLPEGWYVYVKEYSVQWDPHDPRSHLFRYPGFYREIAAIKNVKLIPVNVSTYELLPHCQAVATATGTAGWEAVARSKPVLLFGYPWYMYAPGVFRINGPESVAQAVKKIQEGIPAEPQKLLNYYLALQRVVIKGSVNVFSEKLSTIRRDDSLQNLQDALLKEIQKITNKK